MTLESRPLRYFVAVAEELHFGRAARRLHLAQPGLSQQIQALERQLKVLLFDRTRRSVQLTPTGQALLEEGRRALAQLARAEEVARRTAAGLAGHLTIGVTESASYTVLPKLLHAYRRKHPSVELTVREMPSP